MVEEDILGKGVMVMDGGQTKPQHNERDFAAVEIGDADRIPHGWGES